MTLPYGPYHRQDCGCAYCTRPVLTRAGLDRGDANRASRSRVEEQIQEVLATAPDDWFGGRKEVTDPPDRYIRCDHKHTTNYPSGTFCRDCGRWLET